MDQLEVRVCLNALFDKGPQGEVNEIDDGVDLVDEPVSRNEFVDLLSHPLSALFPTRPRERLRSVSHRGGKGQVKVANESSSSVQPRLSFGLHEAC